MLVNFGQIIHLIAGIGRPRISLKDFMNIKVPLLDEKKQKLQLALQTAPITLFRQDKELKYTWIQNVQVDLHPEDIIGKTTKKTLKG